MNRVGVPPGSNDSADYDQAVRAAMGDVAVAAAGAEGMTMTLEQAFDSALNEAHTT